ncbi:MAG: hypothetical protein J6S84_00660 [Bacteroidales bacterium]|nr:hypothetical protein [Bacteroidales bacterium]
MVEELANYESSYFIMNVSTEADLDIRNMCEKDFAIFFHEYVHFLQDITSFYGYSGIYWHGEYIRRVVNDIYMSDNPVQIPVFLEDKGDFVLLNKRIAEISLGDKSDLNNIFFIKDVFVDSFPLFDTYNIQELHVIANADGETEEIIVGAYAIRENMAYLLERNCTTKYRSSAEFPYQIVELIAQKICPNNKLSDLHIIALCDIALQSSTPGPSIFMMLDAISKGKMAINKPEDIYDFFFSKEVNFLGQKMKTSEALCNAAGQAIDHLLSYLNIDLPISQEYQKWVSFTMSAGVKLRIQKPYFFLDMARGKRDKENAILKFLAKNIGSPQMVNAKGKRFQLATNRPICSFEYLEVVREIEKLFESGFVKCSLKSWCQMSPDGAPIDERCDKAPWRRCNDVLLCPYGVLWKHWHLGGKEIVIKKRQTNR